MLGANRGALADEGAAPDTLVLDEYVKPFTRTPIAGVEVEPLALLAAMPGLTRLRVTGAGLDHRHAIALAASPLAASLRRLDLSANRIDIDGVRALVASPHLQRLVELRLSGNPGRHAAAGESALAERCDVIA